MKPSDYHSLQVNTEHIFRNQALAFCGVLYSVKKCFFATLPNVYKVTECISSYLKTIKLQNKRILNMNFSLSFEKIRRLEKVDSTMRQRMVYRGSI